MHNAFVASLKVVSKKNYFDADDGKFADTGSSLEKATPMSAQHRRLYRTFVANSYRMSLLLLEMQQRQKGDSAGKSKLNLKEVRKFLANAEQEGNSQMFSRLKKF